MDSFLITFTSGGRKEGHVLLETTTNFLYLPRFSKENTAVYYVGLPPPPLPYLAVLTDPEKRVARNPTRRAGD